MALNLFWGGTEVPKQTDRDKQIAAGAEVEALERMQMSEDEVDDDEDLYNPRTAPGVLKRKRTTKTTGPKRRVAGGLAVIARPITADYDSDDGRIIELKQQSHTDDYVAETFKQEGRIAYTAKTIGSRWQKLKKILNDAENDKLDDEMSDWHVGEDGHLKAIFDGLEAKYKKAQATLEQKKWNEVSLHLENKLSRRKYTAKACRERYVGLQDGSALTPIELDEDPEERRKACEALIAARKQARKDSRDAARQAVAMKKAKAEAAQMEKAMANQKLTSMRLKAAEDKANEKRVKEERVNNRLKARRRAEAIRVQLRAENEWRSEKKRQERILYRKLTGKEIAGKPGKSLKKTSLTKDGYESEEAVESEIDDYESEEEEIVLSDGEEEEDEDVPELDDDGMDVGGEDVALSVTPAALPAPTPGARRSARPKKTPAIKSSAQTATPAESTPSKSTPAKAKPKATPTKATPAKATPAKTKRATPKSTPSKVLRPAPHQTPAPTATMVAPVTKETLFSPRSILNDRELQNLLVMRDLPRRGREETHAQVVARIDAVDKMLKSDELGALLIRYSEKSKGKKFEKIERMQIADANRSEAGQMGVSSKDLDFMQRYEGYTGKFKHLVEEAEAKMTNWWAEGSKEGGE